ncbi:MAG: hypothetical protein BM556_06330 [Bacteriovorax sp. MedPE-SWde]|nr:MAG: hypothetical protein BM556_06330 [Bacteriovorax sp. MedPE-SWde]
MAILFIDGHCLICNKLVNFLLKRDHKKILKYSSLQGEYAHSAIPKKYSEDISTVVLKIDDKIYEKSDAAIRAVSCLGFPWKLMLALILLPRPLRDSIYNLLAINRYKLGKRLDACPLAPIEYRDRFL